MPLPEDLFKMSLSDYMLERYNRLARNTIHNAYADKWDFNQWMAVNRLWLLQYCGVTCNRVDPKHLRD